MTGVDDEQRDYRNLIDELGIDLGSISLDESGTIVAERDRTVVAPQTGVPTLAVGSHGAARLASGFAADLVLEHKLAEGGRGEVWQASQTALGRTVAVKRVRAGRRSPADDDALIREGRVLGALEHPGIVPVHGLGRAADGESFVVMRLVGGRPWSTVLQPLYVRGRVPDEAATERHLQILAQVCHAVEYAHSRGVIHRDLKPSNVMVGQFGEVYVLDWGLAVGLDPEGRLPLAASVRTLAGTPAYMAPEMADCDGRRIDRRTDVYLLGAILHELVTGTKRHLGADHLTQLSQAHRSLPVAYGPEVPPELAAICNRATHLDRTQRFASVGEFREAVAAFVRHQGSRQLGAAAADALRRLEAAMTGASVGTVVAPHSLPMLASEARIGFQVALRAWPDNPEAAAGLERALELGVEVELRQRNASGAAAVLAEMRSARPDLVARLRALEAELMRREGELRALQQQRADENLGHDAGRRRRAGLTMAAVLCGAIMLLYALRRAGLHQPGHFDGFAIMALFSIGLVINRQRWRRHVNAAGLRVLDMLAVGSSAVTISFALTWWLGISFSAAVSVALACAGAAASVAAPTVGPRMYATAACFTVGAFATATLPTLLGPVAAGTCVVAFAVAVWAAQTGARVPGATPRPGQRRGTGG
ncbi:MAG: serine/threonine protein kinase [Nannocystaceae bacterium]|nr:serine/threonine protein kinase [Nannocystaceae bacterium]